jgi:DNA polymerase III alpha subunit
MEKLTAQENLVDHLDEEAMIDALDVIETYDVDYLLRSPAEKLSVLAAAQEDKVFQNEKASNALFYFKNLAEKEQSFAALNQRFSEVLS